MKGKKPNLEFVDSFIVECATNNKTSPQAICQEAQTQLISLNRDLKNIKSLKQRRNALIDVLTTFDQYKSSKKIDRIMLPFFTISNKEMAYYLQQQVFNQPLQLNLLKEEITKIAQQMEKLHILRNQDGLLHPDIYYQHFGLFLRKHYGRI